MNNGWSKVPLGDVLQRSEAIADIDPTGRYRQVTVRLWGQGVVQRDEVDGSQIVSGRRFVVQTGQFILSRIDARNGAFGLIPEELDGAVVTNDFPVFDTDGQRMLPEYLGWLSRTRDFVELCKTASEGTTNRVRLKEDRFLSFDIPLPPLAEQRRIVAKLDQLAAKIENAKTVHNASNNSCSALLAAATTELFNSIDVVKKKRIGSLGLNGSNPVQTGPFGAQLHRSEFVDHGVPVLNVGNVWPGGLRLNQLDYVLPEKAESLARYRLKGDDLLFARSGATLGKVCVVPPKCDNWLMTGHLFRVRFDKQRCLPTFAFAALRGAQSVRDQVFAQVRGATRPGFNTTLLSNVELPLPTVLEQRRIVAHLDKVHNKVRELESIHTQRRAELDALLPSLLDKAFKGEL